VAEGHEEQVIKDHEWQDVDSGYPSRQWWGAGRGLQWKISWLITSKWCILVPAEIWLRHQSWTMVGFIDQTRLDPLSDPARPFKSRETHDSLHATILQHIVYRKREWYISYVVVKNVNKQTLNFMY